INRQWWRTKLGCWCSSPSMTRNPPPIVTRSTRATAGPSSITTCAVMMCSSGVTSAPRGSEHQRDPLAGTVRLDRDAVLPLVLESRRHVDQVAVLDRDPRRTPTRQQPDAEGARGTERQDRLRVEWRIGVPVTARAVAVRLKGDVSKPDAEIAFEAIQQPRAELRQTPRPVLPVAVQIPGHAIFGRAEREQDLRGGQYGEVAEPAGKDSHQFAYSSHSMPLV